MFLGRSPPAGQPRDDERALRACRRGPPVPAGDAAVVTLVAVKVLIAATILLDLMLPTMAEELSAIARKTLIDGNTFYVSVRLLDIDAPEDTGGNGLVYCFAAE